MGSVMKPAKRKKAPSKPVAAIAASVKKTVEPTYTLSRKQVEAFLIAAKEATATRLSEILDNLVITQADKIAKDAGAAETIRYTQQEYPVDTDDWHACADMSCFAASIDLEASNAGQEVETKVRVEATRSLKLLADKLLDRAARRHNRLGRG